jgi:hypothetical protein
MRVLGRLVLVLLLLSIVSAVPAHAQNSPHKQQLHTSGRVLPGHSVIIDNKGTIVEILSNTTEDVVPKIYVRVISAQTETALTPTLYDTYRSLVPRGKSRVGVLYRKSILEPSLRIDDGISALLLPPRSGIDTLALSTVM